MAIDFRYVPMNPEPISGQEMLDQTERAINELGGIAEDSYSLAQQALNTANSANAAANEAMTEALDASDAATAARNTADNALTAANTANTTANNADALATQALDTAATAATDAGDALSTANQALDTANTANSTAVTADRNAAQAISIAEGSNAIAKNAMGIFTVITDAQDANEHFVDADKLYLAGAGNSNFPIDITEPIWFMIYINSDGSSVTQTCWDDQNTSRIYTRTAAINNSDPDNPVVTWSPWQTVATPDNLESVEVQVDPAGQPAGTYLVFVYSTINGSETLYINMSQIIGGGYTAGNGAIDISADNQISLKLDSDYSGLTVTSAGLKALPRYEICEFYFFRHPNLRPGFQSAQGGLIENAATLYPQAWAYLQSAEGQLLCKSEAEWQAMTTATWATLANGIKVGWDGVGGAPYYVVDTAAKTIRLPDLRGMYPESAGFDGLTVGGVHGDGIREIEGSTSNHLFQSPTNAITLACVSGGAFEGANYKTTAALVATTTTVKTAARNLANVLKASRVVPTAAKNQPRAWGALACVYLGQPSA